MGLLGFSWWLLSCLSVFLMHLQAVGTGPLVLLHETSVSMWTLALCMPPRCFSLYPRLLMSALVSKWRSWNGLGFLGAWAHKSQDFTSSVL